MSKGQHVVPSGDKWSVRRAGASRASRIFATQQEAVARATEIARNQKTELYTHGRDGRIQQRSSFSADPYPPKG